MALAEIVIRKVNKLGLIPKAIKLLPKLSLLFAIFSCVWLVTLPQDGNYRNVYISENALMPAQATSYFRESEWNIVRGYREEIEKLKEQPIEVRNKVLESWMKDIGLQVSYHHNGFANDTLYAIMHAPRGENTEAMAMVAPWVNSDDEYNVGAISLAVTLARYFMKMSIWSKNIIVVFPENGHKPLRSWVEAYHTSLDETAGSIEAAVVMEYGENGDYFEHYDMFYEGLNGQLPNLDLLNTANMVSYHEQIPIGMQGITNKVIDYTTRLKTLVKGVIKLTLIGLTDEVHGCEAFSGWQIQAFTIKARGREGRDVTQFGRIVDSTFRSVNNLLEKFHQSFFFYLMLSPKHFVSIGTYLPSAVFLAVSYALTALNVVLKSGFDFANTSAMLMVMTAVEVVCVGIAYYGGNQYVLMGLGVLVLIPRTGVWPHQLLKQLQMVLIMSICILITGLMIIHFSLALTIGLLAMPLNLLVTKKKSIGRSVILMLANPFVIIFAAGHALGHPELFMKLTTSWNDLQCWTWFVVVLAWFPAWVIIAITYWADPGKEKTE